MPIKITFPDRSRREFRHGTITGDFPEIIIQKNFAGFGNRAEFGIADPHRPVIPPDHFGGKHDPFTFPGRGPAHEIKGLETVDDGMIQFSCECTVFHMDQGKAPPGTGVNGPQT